MKINELLAELGSQMGLDNLKLDENGVCRLVFDKKYTVDIEESEGGNIAHMYSSIGTVPPENKVPFLEALLAANLFGKETGGAALALDSSHQEVFLCRAFAMNATDYQDFVNTLESFVNHIEMWSDNIESGKLLRDINVTSESLPQDEGFIKA